MLAELVKAGDLPTVGERLPTDPLEVEPTESVGVYGGSWNSWLSSPDSTFEMYVQVGYDGLVRWDPDWTGVIPNLASSWEINGDGREYVLQLREGVKWSDGEPLTADDIVFAYDDVLTNTEISPVVSQVFIIKGEPAIIEKVNDNAVRFVFAAPSGLFLQYLASPLGNRLLLKPRHYVQRFHKKYNPDVEDLADQENFPGWPELFLAKDDEWANADRPTLNAWRVRTPVGEGNRVVLERNPFYWKTDPEGSQLPYLDKVLYPLISDLEVALLQTTNGEIDFNHPTYIGRVATLQNKPILARNRENGDYRFVASVSAAMNQMVIAFNLTHKDPVLREVFQNRDFRIGLSYAIDRDEIIDAVYQRQGEPWQTGPRRESGLFMEELAKQYTEHDLGKANAHLDRAGYSDRDDEGIRLGPDGRRLTFLVEAGTEHPDHISALELIRGYWREVGVDMQIKAEARTLFYERKSANEHDANVWTGNGALFDAVLDPNWYFPTTDESNFAVPWAAWYESGGKEGIEPAPAARQQMDLYDQLKLTADEAERRDLFMQILRIAQQQFWAIGTVLPVGDYGTVKNTFRNVPDSMPGDWIYPTPGPTRPEQYYID